MTMTLSTHESMLQSADEQLAALDTRLDTIKERLQTLTVAQDTLKQGQETSEQKQTEAQAAIAHYEGKHNQAEAYAKLAKGTLKERAAINAAAATRRELVKARETHEQQHESYNEHKLTISAQKTALQEQAIALGQELDALLQERKDLLSGREQAQAEMGTTKYWAHMEEYRVKQQVVEDLKAQLLTAEMDLHDTYTTALDDLRPWPAYQHGIRDLVLPDDEVLQAAHAAINYANAMLSAKYKFDHRLALDVMKTPSGTRPMYEALILPENDILNAIGQSTNGDSELCRRRDRLSTVIYQYGQHLRYKA